MWRRYWPESDSERHVDIASQRALSAFCSFAGLAGVAVTLINLRQLPDYALAVGLGGVISVLCLVCPLWINRDGDFRGRARIVGFVTLTLLAALSSLSNNLVTPNNILLAPAILTFTLAVGWRSGLAVLVAVLGIYGWNYAHTPAPLLAISDYIDFTTILTALVMNAVFIFCGALIFLREMTRAARELEAAKREAEATMRHFRQRAATDALTGVANRGALDELLELQFERHQSGRAPLSVIILDLDHFKQVNDRYGHAVGDQVLVEAARRVESCLPATDTLARLGGEEFAIVLQDTGHRGAARLAETLRLAIEDMSVRSGDQQSVRVTASLGLASTEDNPRPRSVAELMELADQRLYHAKRSGRNRVVAWIPPAATGYALSA
ncbi:GGDEF domain-containing protein [Maricaulis sp. CAU 1757]